jgi:single-strand DNA-binding protein
MTKDCEYKKLQNGQSVGTFNLAITRAYSEGADFINCVAYGKTAELINQYLHKGDQLGVTGRIRTSSYEKDGKKSYSTSVVVDQIDFVGAKKSDSKETTKENPKSTPAQSEPKDAFEEFASEVELTDEDLPF